MRMMRMMVSMLMVLTMVRMMMIMTMMRMRLKLRLRMRMIMVMMTITMMTMMLTMLELSPVEPGDVFSVSVHPGGAPRGPCRLSSVVPLSTGVVNLSLKDERELAGVRRRDHPHESEEYRGEHVSGPESSLSLKSARDFTALRSTNHE